LIVDKKGRLVKRKDMMTEPEKSSQQEELFEWAYEDGQWLKITPKNSNGRKCGKCGCNCPCRCDDCKIGCCSNRLLH